MSPAFLRFLTAVAQLVLAPFHFCLTIFSELYYWYYGDKFIDVSGKAAVISGCDSGFGNVAAKLFASRDVTVFAGCLTQDGIRQFSAVNNVRPFIYDVTSEESTQHAKDFVLRTCQEDGLVVHALICNAGVASLGPVDWMRVDDYERTFAVNLTGHIRSVLAFLPSLKDSKGRIVIMSSLAGYLVSHGFSCYASSKFAIRGFAEAIRCDLSRFGMHVAVLAPEFYPTAILGNWAAVEKRWEQLPEGIKQDHPHVRLERSRKYYEKIVADARKNEPTEIAEAYFHACYGAVPRLTYVLGAKAPLYELVTSFHDFTRKLFADDR